MRLKAIIQNDRITWCYPPFWVIGFLALTATAFLTGGTFFLRMHREAAAGGLMGWWCRSPCWPPDASRLRARFDWS